MNKVPPWVWYDHTSYNPQKQKDEIRAAIDDHTRVSRAFFWCSTKEGDSYWLHVYLNGHTPDSFVRLCGMLKELEALEGGENAGDSEHDQGAEGGAS